MHTLAAKCSLVVAVSPLLPSNAISDFQICIRPGKDSLTTGAGGIANVAYRLIRPKRTSSSGSATLTFGRTAYLGDWPPESFTLCTMSGERAYG